MLEIRKLVFVLLVSVLVCSQLGLAGYVGEDGTVMRFGKYSSPYSFVVEQFNSTHYQSINASGYTYQSTNASAVFQTAREGLGTLASGAKGDIFVKTGTYQISKDIILGKITHLHCEAGTVFNVTANLDCGAIVIDTTNVLYTDWAIEDVTINMNDFNGDGIYSTNASQTGSITKSAIKNIYIYGVKAGYAGINLTNAFVFDFNQIRISTNGIGIKLKLNDVLIAGNGIWHDVYIGLGANGAVGLEVDESATKHYTLMQFDRFQVYGVGYDDTVGIKLNGTQHCQFNKVDIEGCDIGVCLNDTDYIDFFAPFIWDSAVVSDCVGFFIEDGATRNMIFGGTIQSATGAWSYVDNSTAGASPGDENSLSGVTVYKEWYIANSNTRFDRCYLWNTNSGSAKATFNTASRTVADDEWVPHYVSATPTYVVFQVVTATYDSVPVVVHCATSNSTHFQVTVYWTNGTAITADAISIIWIAEHTGA